MADGAEFSNAETVAYEFMSQVRVSRDETCLVSNLTCLGFWFCVSFLVAELPRALIKIVVVVGYDL